MHACMKKLIGLYAFWGLLSGLPAQPYAPEILLSELEPYEIAWLDLPEEAQLSGLDSIEWVLLDSLSEQCFRDIQSKGTSGRIPPQSLEHYVRQYIPYNIPEQGKFVYINAAPYLDPGVRHPNKELIIVMDGGPDYWQMIIRLDDAECIDFQANGEG